MAIAFVQQATNSASTGTTIVVTIAAPAAGSLLVCLSAGAGTPHISSISGGGVTWVQATQTGFSANVDTWYGPKSSGSGTSITVTYNATLANGTCVNIQEYSGVVAVSPLDKTNTANGGAGSTNPATGATATTLQSDELCVGCAGLVGDSVPSAGPTNSFNALTHVSNTSRGLICAYRIVSATGAYSTDWTVTSTQWDAAIITFKGIVNVPDDDELASYPCAPMGGRTWPVSDSAKAQEDWIQKIFLPSFAPASDEWDGRNLPWPARQPDHYAEQGFNPTLFIPPFDPTTVPQSEQTDVYGRAWTMLEEVDYPLNIFLPPPGWDDGFDYSFQPTVKLEQYGEEGSSPIIPAAYDDDFLYSYQPQMRIDDERDYLMRIFIPVAVWDDDWQMATSPQMKLDDERDYQMRIFLPRQAWDDDFQSLLLPTVKLEDSDSPLQLFLPPFDPTVVRDGEQIQQVWPSTVKWDDEREYLMRIFIPVVAWDDDWQAGVRSMTQLEEADSPLQLFLPPFDPTIVRDEEQVQWATLWPARLSVEPEGEWPNLIVVSVIEPPPPGPQPLVSRFRLHQGVRITRGF